MTNEKAEKNIETAGAISTFLLCVVAGLCLFISIQVSTRGYVDFFGYSVFRVVTGSMEPTLPVGSLLVCKAQDVDQIQPSDIVCFRSKEKGRLGKVVTHRVLTVLQDDSGQLYLETKGDANLSVDGYYVTQDNLIGRVIWHSNETNWLQSVLTFITQKEGFLSCIVFPILLLSGLILRDNVKNVKKEMQQVLNELERESSAEAREKTAAKTEYAAAAALAGLTEQEYQEMYDRIRAELIEELKQDEKNHTSEPEQGSQETR